MLIIFLFIYLFYKFIFSFQFTQSVTTKVDRLNLLPPIIVVNAHAQIIAARLTTHHNND